jgi:two-component system response regulator YesN
MRAGRRKDEGCRSVVREIEQFLKNHYCDKITLEETAKHFHLNKNYLSELFKDETGQTFTRYVNTLRIQKAKQLILHTTDTVSDISEKIGFGDFRYFSKVFRAYTGLSPTEFKMKTAPNP